MGTLLGQRFKKYMPHLYSSILFTYQNASPLHRCFSQNVGREERYAGTFSVRPVERSSLCHHGGRLRKNGPELGRGAVQFSGGICAGYHSTHKARHDIFIYIYHLLSVDNVPIIYGLLCLKCHHVCVKAIVGSTALLRGLN